MLREIRIKREKYTKLNRDEELKRRERWSVCE